MAKARKEIAESQPDIEPGAEAAVPARTSLFDRIAAFLDEDDWRYTAMPEKRYFSLDCRIKEAPVRVLVCTSEREDWQRILVFSVYPVYVPEERRAAVLEMMNRVNYGMIVGNFEMDPEDGEIRLRTVAESEEDIPVHMIRQSLNVNLMMADKHFATLMGANFNRPAHDDHVEAETLPEGTILQ